LKPNTPHSGSTQSDSVSGASKPKARATSCACVAIGALTVQHELGRAGRARGGEDVAGAPGAA
jgi:hypothetical protein